MQEQMDKLQQQGMQKAQDKVAKKIEKVLPDKKK